MGIAHLLSFAVVAHLDADVGTGVAVVEVTPLVALVELDKKLAVIPGECGDIGIAFGVALKFCISMVFFQNRVVMIELMYELNNATCRLFFEVAGDFGTDEVLRKLRLVGGVNVALVSRASVACSDMQRLIGCFLDVVEHFDQLIGNQVLIALHGQGVARSAIAIKERLIRFVEDGGI